MQANKKTTHTLENTESEEISAENLQIISALDDWQNASLENNSESSPKDDEVDQSLEKLTENPVGEPLNSTHNTSKEENNLNSTSLNLDNTDITHELTESNTSSSSQKNITYEPTEDELLQTASSLDDWQIAHMNEARINSINDTKLEDDTHLKNSSTQNINSLSEDIEDTRQEIIKDSSLDVNNEKNKSQSTNSVEEQDYSYRHHSSEEFTTPEENTEFTAFEEVYSKPSLNNTETKEANSYNYRRSSSEEVAPITKKKESKNDLFRPNNKTTDDYIDKQTDSTHEEVNSYNRSFSESPPIEESKQLELDSFGFRRRNHEKPLTQEEKRKNDIDDPFGLRRSPVDDIYIPQSQEKVAEKSEKLELTDTSSLFIDEPPKEEHFVSPVKTGKTYLFTAVALSILLIAQIGFNFRHILLGTPKNAPEKVTLLSHNVFAHPTDNNILFVSASIENNADFNQPYPVLEVRLNDNTGNLVALRRFTPDEYLITYSQGQVFGKKQQTNVSLKIQDPGSQATRFQFDFL